MNASRTDSTSNSPPSTDKPGKKQTGKSAENTIANANDNRGMSTASQFSANRSNTGRQQPQKRKISHTASGNKKGKLSRNWEASTRRDRNVDTRPVEGQEEGEKEERRPKKKVACFIGYSGEGYHGMQ
jgi:hypothetical protein